MIGNLNANTSPSYVADPTTGRLVIGGRELGDTGWRYLPSGILVNGWTFDANGTIRVRRIASALYIAIYNLRGTSATGATICTLPQGFMCNDYAVVPIYGPTVNDHLTFHPDGLFNAGLYGGAAFIGAGYVVMTPPVLTYPDWPTSLPGTMAIMADPIPAPPEVT